MKTIENQEFNQCDVTLDNKKFVNCKFLGCRFLFDGEGGFSLNHRTIYDDSFMAIHEDICTIIEALSLLPEYGGVELFSIVSNFIQGKSSYKEYTESIKQRSPSNPLLNGKLFTTIGVIRSRRNFPTPLRTQSHIDHIHQKIDLKKSWSSGKNQIVRDGAKYVYLPQEWMVKTWIDGGKLPIKPSITYKSDERKQQMTPDENLVLHSNMSLQDAHQLGFDFQGHMQFISFSNNVTSTGQTIPDIYIRELKEENGLVLCFANSYSKSIAARFDRKFCVRINDIELLKNTIENQLGATGISGNCNYTIDHNRNTFLKHIEDAWQDEFRIFWPTLKDEVLVDIPQGSATAVAVSEYQNLSLDELKRVSSMYATQLIEIDRRGFQRRPVVVV